MFPDLRFETVSWDKVNFLYIENDTHAGRETIERAQPDHGLGRIFIVNIHIGYRRRLSSRNRPE